MKKLYFLLICFLVETGPVVGQKSPLHIDHISAFPSTVCLGDSSRLTVYVSGGTFPYFYRWTPGDLTDSSVVVAPADTTEYTIEVTDSEDQLKKIRSVVSGTITVNVNSLPRAFLNGGGNTCQFHDPVPIVFTGINGSPPYVFYYTDNFGDTIQSSPVPSTFIINHSANTIGQFEYFLLGVSDSNGCYHLESDSVTIIILPQGQVNLPEDQNVCHNTSTDPIVFTTNNPDGITTYTWVNDNPQIGLQATSGYGNIPSFTGINNGNSPVYANITVTPYFHYLADSCSGTSKNFRIFVNPLGQVNEPEDQIVCNGSDTNPIIFITPNTTGGTIICTWTNDNPEIGLPSNGTGNIASFIAINNNTSAVTATIMVTPHFYYQINGYCTGVSKSFTITVNPSPTADFTANDVCEGSVTTFTDMSGGDVNSWLWDFGDGQTSTEENPEHTYASFGEKIITLTVKNSVQNCPGIKEKKVIVYSNPEAGFSYQNVCDGSPAEFTDLSTNSLGTINNWLWRFGDGAVSTDQHASYIYASPGIFGVKLIIKTSETGCSDSISQNITVSALPSFDISGPDKICPNLKNTLYSIDKLLNADLEASEISWEVNNGSITGDHGNPIIVNWQENMAMGNISCTITNKLNGCISPTIELPVTCSVEYSAPEPETVVVKTLDGVPVLLIYPEPGFSYTWYKNDEPISNANLQYYYPGTDFNPLEYKVYIEPAGYSGDFICGNFASPAPSIHDQKYYTFSRDDVFLVYPNPASDAISVVMHESVAGTSYNDIDLRILNPACKSVLEQKITSWETNIGITHLVKGFYFVEVIISGSIKQAKKLIIQ
ncbi:MAG: PKD domain-containing protein [Lentimicrobium sp.]